MPPLASGVSVAARFPVSAGWEAVPAVDDRPGIAALSGLRRGGVGHGGNRVRADAELVDDLVCCPGVCNQSARRGECPGAEARSWLGELSNGLDVVAQIEARHATSGSGLALRTH